ncbi:hypothetical protein ESZ53_00370 [Salinibacterium sp. UTAS2018]|uniref:acyltransferase family protein n=1 Tax=Salinibacterium sp. UTAS2018 TaxID=2508880 RepID=UPI00100945A0|nr:acyltransferase family protein [Salinibacterium sp. UTAS2018]QAV69030.1 hypothetical protein ESZ53_00370 [Salinibacterium sp. UTAS2018]
MTQNTSRDPYLDNAKAILIILVVVGHVIERIDRGSADGVYTWIYLFHMPAFVFVSGYFSRSFVGNPKQMASLISVLIAPYVLFQIIFALENWLILGNNFELRLFVPGFALWYLLALLVWRLVIPLLRAVRHPVLISFAVSILSVLAGGVSQDLSAARILSFLPFFTLGLFTTPDHIDKFKRLTAPLWVRVGTGTLFAAAVVATYLAHDVLPRRWIYMYGQMDTFGLTEVEHVVVRVGVLVTASVMSLVFFSLVPRFSSPLTVLGQRTLQIYLLHTIVLYPLRPLIGDWSDWTIRTVALAGVFGVALAVVLGTRAVARATRWLTDPLALVALVRGTREGPARL